MVDKYAFKEHRDAEVYAEPFDKLKTGSVEVRKRKNIEYNNIQHLGYSQSQKR